MKPRPLKNIIKPDERDTRMSASDHLVPKLYIGLSLLLEKIKKNLKKKNHFLMFRLNLKLHERAPVQFGGSLRGLNLRSNLSKLGILVPRAQTEVVVVTQVSLPGNRCLYDWTTARAQRIRFTRIRNCIKCLINAPHSKFAVSIINFVLSILLSEWIDRLSNLIVRILSLFVRWILSMF